MLKVWTLRVFGVCVPVLWAGLLLGAVNARAGRPADPVYARNGSLHAAKPATDDFTLILQRLKTFFTDADYSHADGWLALMAADGHWPDLEPGRARNGWANQHVSRLAEMAAAYATSASPDYHSAKMLEGVGRGLQFWYKERQPIPGSWWQNTIGTPLTLSHALVPVGDALPPGILQNGLTYYVAPDETGPEVRERLRLHYPTSQDLVWFAQEQLIRGALAHSRRDLAEASQSIQEVLLATPNDGIQADMTFHIHGEELYNGGYGHDFTIDCARYATALAGTPYAFTHAKLTVLADYLLEGTGHMIRGKMVDYSALGRTLVRKNSGERAVELEAACEQLAALLPERSGELMALEKHIAGTGASYSFIGNRYFWNSNFMTHQREGYYISVKMVGNGTVGTETINGENLKGCWLPFGATWILRRGDEYTNIFPVLDWGRIPGVTSPHMTTDFAEDVTQPERFVGGVSDGTYGAAAMMFDESELLPEMNLELLRLRGLNGTTQSGNKGWFFFDNEMVALGSGIVSWRYTHVNTTLNQTLLHGPVLMDGHELEPGQTKVPMGAGVLHDGVGYTLLESAAASVKFGPQTGDWQSISAGGPDAPVTEQVFSLWIDHGANPRDGHYAYAVVPGVDAPKLAAWVAHPPVRVVANDVAQQAVMNDALGVAEIIYYKPGKITLTADSSVEVDRRCMVLMVGHGEATRIAVSSPGGETATVHLTYTTSQTSKRLTFDLPTGVLGGKSAVMDVPGRW